MKPTLLIADGDAVVCELYRLFFAGRGYEVETCTDGLDCLKKLRQATAAVLVLDRDLRWGGSDGVLAWLREERPTLGVSVILTTTSGFPQDCADLIKHPVVDCLPKPFTLTVLLESVGAAVAKMGRIESSNSNDVPARLELVIGG